MQRNILKVSALACVAIVLMLGFARHAYAQDVKTPYPTMAPLEQYLMSDRNAEIALARTAAPDSISKDADVMVLGRHGYETAVKGKNGFRLPGVARMWPAQSTTPTFGDPTPRSPVCLPIQPPRGLMFH